MGDSGVLGMWVALVFDPCMCWYTVYRVLGS